MQHRDLKHLYGAQVAAIKQTFNDKNYCSHRATRQPHTCNQFPGVRMAPQYDLLVNVQACPTLVDVFARSNECQALQRIRFKVLLGKCSQPYILPVLIPLYQFSKDYLLGPEIALCNLIGN
jgi:hypothetical protein